MFKRFFSEVLAPLFSSLIIFIVGCLLFGFHRPDFFVIAESLPSDFVYAFIYSFASIFFFIQAMVNWLIFCIFKKQAP